MRKPILKGSTVRHKMLTSQAPSRLKYSIIIHKWLRKLVRSIQPSFTSGRNQSHSFKSFHKCPWDKRQIWTKEYSFQKMEMSMNQSVLEYFVFTIGSQSHVSTNDAMYKSTLKLNSFHKWSQSQIIPRVFDNFPEWRWTSNQV